MGYLALAQWNAQRVRSFWRIYWNPMPGAVVLQHGKAFGVDPGVVVLIPPEVPVDQILHRPVETLFVHVSTSPAFERTSRGVLRLPAPRWWLRMARDLSRALQTGSGSSRREACLGEALAAGALSLIDPAEWQSQHIHPRLAAVVALLERQTDRVHPNPALARLAHLSTNAFVRLFQREMGLPPQQYALRRRLREAERLLLSTNLTVEAVAGRCGFCDRSHFIRAFRSSVGTTPAAFRHTADP